MQNLSIDIAKHCMMPNYAPYPFVVSHGIGSTLFATDGQAFLDFTSGIGVNAVGHAHPDVVQAVCQQAQRFLHTGNMFYQQPAIDICNTLSRLLMQNTRFTEPVQVFLCNSGTEAIEAALKMACRYFYMQYPYDVKKRRHTFVAAYNGFHGRTLGSLAVTGQEVYQEGFKPLLANTRFVPFDDIDALAQAVTSNTAAVILEPIQGNGGVRVPTSNYLQRVQEICKQHGCLLIIDEVQTGIGRTGRWFAYEYDNIVPDIICMAKALGGGLPLGAIAAQQSLAHVFQPGVHASTFGGNPIACAAGLATLDVIEKNNLLQHAIDAGNHYKHLLQTILQPKHPTIIDIRGRGLLIGLKCQQPVKTLQRACRARGLLTTSAGCCVLRLFPPLHVTYEELERSIAMLDQALCDIRQ